MEEIKWVALLTLIAGCTQSDIGTDMLHSRPYTSLPGENVASAAFDEQRGETSLVSLFLPRVEGVVGVEDIDAVNRLTDEEIVLHSFGGVDDFMVVTLELAKGRVYSPLLKFHGTDEGTFAAHITPKHEMESHLGLLDGPSIILRDTRVAYELVEGQSTEIPPEDFSSLWLDNRLQTAARVHFTNTGESGWFSVWWTEGCQVWMQRAGRLEPALAEVELERHECIGIMIVPDSDVPVILRLERSSFVR